ncbi:MAG: hypothetical protein NTV21_14640 [Planctomycetota bacterium]|nr:hypothetical protein [Planctomycetota bacterium]
MQFTHLVPLAFAAALSSAAARAQTTLLHEKFEAGLGHWTTSSTSTFSRWHLVTEGSICHAKIDPFPSTAHAVRFGNAAPGALCNFSGETADDLTLAAPIAIPAGATNVRLEFWSFEDTECTPWWGEIGNCGWDHRTVSVSTNGGASWTQVTAGGPEGTWRQVGVDLTAFAGQSILLRFRFDPVDSVQNDFAGWILDEIRLTYGAPGPVNYCESSLNSLGCAPVLHWSGSATLTGPDDFVVGVHRIHNQRPARILWGFAPSNHPFNGSTMCIASPIVRTPLAAASGATLPTSNCSGTHDFAFTQAYMASKFLTAGDTIYAQYSGRDPFKAAPNNRNSSNAIRVTIAP